MAIPLLLLLGSCVALVAWYFPDLRKAVLAIAAILVVLVTAYLRFTTPESQLQFERIGPDQLAFEAVTLDLEAGARRIEGRLHNLSPQFTLRDVDLRVSLLDCPAEGECEIIGEDKGRANVQIPPGQTRAFSVPLVFSNLPTPLGELRWEFDVEAIRATE